MIKKLLMCAGLFVLLFACAKTTKPETAVSKPRISPIPGLYFSTQTISMTDSQAGATIYYTKNGTIPTTGSLKYTLPFNISDSTLIIAKAFKSGMKASADTTALYTFGVSPLGFHPEGGTFTLPQSVSISGITYGTVIHYTLDGSIPSEASPIYHTALLLDGNATLKARGYVAGRVPSAIRSADYVFNATTPSFSVADGNYASSFPVTISTLPTDATIRYTTDGNDPTESSTVYTDPITVNVNTVIKAQAFKLNWNSSAIKTASYTLQVATPTINPMAGNYFNPQTITMAVTTPGASIYYTTDGNDPTTGSTHYTAPFTLAANTMSANAPIKARAFITGWTASGLVQNTYIFNVHAPVLAPDPGIFLGGQEVTITCATPDAVIRYTTNNTDPTSSSTIYSAPIDLITTTTIKAKAFKTGLNASPVVSGTYSISSVQTVATPVIGPANGTYSVPQSVTMTCSSTNATIRYTTDGTEPNVSSRVYSTPISLAASAQVKAKAFKLTMNDSATAVADYVINYTAGVMITIPAGTFIMGKPQNQGFPADVSPAHQVTLSAYQISKYEITQAEWLQIMFVNPAFYSNDIYQPVENVSWFDVLTYCNQRSINESLTPAYSINGATDPSSWGSVPTVYDSVWNTVSCNFNANGYRLPTEAECEYAADGGAASQGYLFSGSNTASDVAWYQVNSGGNTHIIGHLAANEISLYDMSGNVNEWCWDWYDGGYYTQSAVTNPTGPAAGSYRSTRGGGWADYSSDKCRVVDRDGNPPYYHSYEYGFRVVRSITSGRRR